MRIPGAEFAPIIALNFFAQPSASPPDEEALAAFLVHEGYAPGEPFCWRTGIDRTLHILPQPITIRRLSVCDPDDQRAIWRLAALALGATEEEALTAILIVDHGVASLVVIGMGRLLASDRWEPPMGVQSRVLAEGAASDPAHATAALCLAVWGPK